MVRSSVSDAVYQIRQALHAAVDKRTMKARAFSIIRKTVSRLTADPYLVLFVIIGAFLRFYHIHGQSIWYDEAFSIRFAELKLSQILLLQENSPPLYYVILHWWVQLFGISEFSVRAPSALFGVLSIVLIYKTGGLLFGREAGRLSSFLMTLSLFHISFSQEARAYSLSVLMALLSMYFFLRLLESGHRKDWVRYALFSVLLIYSHIYGAFIILSQNIYIVLWCYQSKVPQKCTLRSWIISQAIIAVLFLPWIGIFLDRIHEVQQYFWIGRPTMDTIYLTFKTFSSEALPLLLVFLTLTVLSPIRAERRQGRSGRDKLFSFFGMYRWKIDRVKADRVCFLLLWLLTPIVVPFIISFFSQPIYLTRYTIVALPAFFLLAAGGFCNLRNNSIKSITILMIGLLSLMQLSAYYTQTNKEQWRDVARQVDMACHKGDLLLFKSWACVLPFDYYSRCDQIIRKGIKRNRLPSADATAGGRYVTLDDVISNQYARRCTSDGAGCEENFIIPDDDRNALLDAARNYQRVWLITSHSGRNKKLVIDTLAQSRELSIHEKYFQIELYAFDRQAP